MNLPAANLNAPTAPVRRVGLTVGKLRDLIRNLPDSMDVRFVASVVGTECHVNCAEVYPRTKTLMLSDVCDPAYGATVLFDTTQE
jgi:hypothetical protein